MPSSMPAEWSGKGLLLISLLILPFPLVSHITCTPETAVSPATHEAIDNAAHLSRILASLRDIRFSAGRSAADRFEAPLLALPAGLPVLGTVSSEFGLRLDPFSGLPEFHKGIDIAAPRGTPVSATAGGDVLWAGWQGNYGKTVILAHPHGHETRYAHLDRILVRQGDWKGKRTGRRRPGASGRRGEP
jgi:murein DD-endopeptidase MepM/ murein hydrolase activator NlpD